MRGQPERLGDGALSKPPLKVRPSGEQPEPGEALERGLGDPAREPAGGAQRVSAADRPEWNLWTELDELGVVCPPL